MEEVWKDIPGYEGRYQVSNFGEVRSPRKVLRPNVMPQGYTCVHLYCGGKKTRKVVTIHKLVARAFIDNPAMYVEVNHKNFVKSDNHVNNLEWVSRGQNVRHAVAAGRRCKPEKKVCCIDISTGAVRKFDSFIAAEGFFKGHNTGRVSQAIAKNTLAYGCAWWLA